MKVPPDSEKSVLSDLMIQVEAIQYRLGKIRKTDVSKEDIAAIITGYEKPLGKKGDSKNAS